MFPVPEYYPISTGEDFDISLVASHVAGDLVFPVGAVPLWGSPVSGAAMPEAAVNEDRHPLFSEHDIGLTAQGVQWSDVLAEAEASAVQQRAYLLLWSSVPSSVSLHCSPHFVGDCSRGVGFGAKPAQGLGAGLHWTHRRLLSAFADVD